MNGADPPPVGGRSNGAGGTDGTQSIAAAIADVSERASQLVREEIELAKAEMSEKASKLAKGAVVGVAAGVFFITALFFVLVGCAWLLYFYLPIGNDYTYFYGFFAMAIILVVLGVLAGVIAAKAVKRGSPPVPNMALAEARKIRESVGPPATATVVVASPPPEPAPPVPEPEPLAPEPEPPAPEPEPPAPEPQPVAAEAAPAEPAAVDPSTSEIPTSDTGAQS